MTDAELRELQDPDNWDFEQAEEYRPTKRARAVISVAFPRDDYDRVSDAATREGMKISEYIREAALARATYRPRRSRILGVSGGGLRGIGGDVTTAWRRAKHLQGPMPKDRSY